MTTTQTSTGGAPATGPLPAGLLPGSSPTSERPDRSRSKTASRRIVTLAAFSAMFVGALTMVLPFLWMLSTALKESKFVYSFPPDWIPDPVDWRNFVEVFEVAPLAQGLLNSFIVTGLVVVLGTFSSTMAAFAFAKLDFPHKEKLFIALLGTMMIPAVVTIIPQFLVYSELGWIDTLLPLIVPGTLGNVIMIFFLRQYMTGLSSELMDAARIDGAGIVRTYWSIFMPLCRPAIAANVIIVFMTTWNDYLNPLIFTHSPQNSTVQLVIASLTSYYEEQTDFPIVMAASIIAVIPVITLFIIFQKHFVNSFALSGIKG